MPGGNSGFGIAVHETSTHGPVSRIDEDAEPGVGAEAKFDGGSHYSYDTQISAFVRAHSPSVPQPSSSAPSKAAGRPDTSSSSSRNWDNALSGRNMLYDGVVKAGHSLRGPFEDGHLQVSRNALTNYLKFHCRVGGSSETHRIRGTKAEMVPLDSHTGANSSFAVTDDVEMEPIGHTSARLKA